ncbi:MAG TPA: YfaZ family outer membrane protein [Steroidobacteraceae bacterium]|nr:YfaZ family outer membrane protein [Steroidobacteraceae bacterium]
MKYGLALGCLLLFAGAGVYAQEPRPDDASTYVEATGGNSVLQLRYLSPSPWAATGGASRSDLDYGFLLSEDRDIILSSALMFHTNLHLLPGLTIDIGPQGYLALLSAATKTNVFAVAFGADARYLLLPRWGIAAFGSAYYSPGVLTFGSAHNLYDFTAGAQVQFTPRLGGLAGYRWLKFTTVNAPDVRVQNEVFVGLRWQMQ